MDSFGRAVSQETFQGKKHIFLPRTHSVDYRNSFRHLQTECHSVFRHLQLLIYLRIIGNGSTVEITEIEFDHFSAYCLIGLCRRNSKWQIYPKQKAYSGNSTNGKIDGFDLMIMDLEYWKNS